MNELTMQLIQGSSKFLYEQIYEYIRNEIKTGKLSRDEKLPSTRLLAVHLQVSRSTVDLAYEQLVSEGYIEARPCKGYFVCSIEDLYHLPQSHIAVNNPPKTIIDEPEFDFHPNGLDLEHFPFNAWRKITKNVLSADRKELFQLGDPMGDDTLRQSIAKYLFASRGVNCFPGQIIIGAGNEYLLMLLSQLLGKHNSIAMENPTYIKAFQIFRSLGHEIRLLSPDESGMRVNELKSSGCSIAYVMPSHQYPLGIVMPIGRRIELLNWAKEEELRYLIEDDYDSEFRYRGKPIPSLQAADSAYKVIYMGTFSKSIAPAIRVSFMVLPETLLNIYHASGVMQSSTVSRIDQTILNEFISEGYYERHLNKMRTVYKGKHDVLMGELKKFNNRFKISGENSGLHVLLNFTKGSEEALVRSAGRVGVKVYGISACFADGMGNNPDKPIILMGYGGMTEKQICDGIHRLLDVWNELE